MGLLPLAALAAAVAGLVVVVGRRRGSTLRTALLGFTGSALAWVGAVAVESTGWKDTDGWIDCQPNCDVWHEVGAVAFWVPLLVAAALLAVAAVAALQRFAAQR